MAQTQETQEKNDHPRDIPSIDPQTDRLGYTTFAKYLADSICQMTFEEGFVIAVQGPWGSGKSTLLNFVVHYLQQKPEEEQPIIVPFNPWLFSGHQDITKRFFDQLQDVLTKETYVPKGVKERIAAFAQVIAEIPLPYAQAGRAVATLFDDKQKEASDLKEEVEDTVVQQKQRIVVTVDDIDRLPTEDIKQLFRIFKAIPGFNNVVYLLVFDKEVISKALSETKEASPEAYLNKIIQVTFELPSPDKISLRRLLFEKLDIVLTDTPKELIEQTRWGNIYFQGLDHFITNLRNIASLSDHIILTYPVVKGEVNVVDFIVLQSLRVFCPTAYDIIRKNKNAFVGYVNSSVEEFKNFHNTWSTQLQDEDKEPVKKLLMHLFPKLEVVWGNTEEGKQESKWREQLRICCPEIFPTYFRLVLSEGELFNTQIKTILPLACDTKALGENLVELANQIRPDGTTQVRAFLESLDYDSEEIPTDCIGSIVFALFDVGEQLLRPEDQPHTMFDVGNEIIISRIISNQLRRLDEPARFDVLKTAISQGKALSIINSEVETWGQQQGKSDSDTSIPEAEWLISAQHLKELEEIVAKRQQEKDSDDKSSENLQETPTKIASPKGDATRTI